MSWGEHAPQPFRETRAAEGCRAGPVGLVKAGLEHEQEPQAVGDSLDLASQLERMLLGLDDIGACHDEKGLRSLQFLEEPGLLGSVL